MKHFISILIATFAIPALAFAQNFKIGDLITNEDGSKGVVFYVNADHTDGWMVALSDLQTRNWGLSSDIDGIDNISYPNQLLEETDGFANTGKIRNHHSSNGYTSTYAAGMVDYENGWYIPTAGQLMKLCSMLDKINDKLTAFGGTMLQQRPYFSSSESSWAQVWAVDFGSSSSDWGGQFETHSKSETAYFRAVRNISYHNDCVIEIDVYGEGCGSYIYHGTNYTESGVYEQFIENPNGCDTLATVHVDMVENFFHTFSASACDSYSWNGITYNESGTYQQAFSTHNGCDSIVQLELTIEPSPYVSEIVGEQFIYINDHGNYTYSIEPVEGAYDYVWFIDNNWIISNAVGSNTCTINVNCAGSGNLTVRVYSECGYTERTIHIEHSLQPDIVVFPNPTYGDFKLYHYGMDGETLIEIYDEIGQRIAQFTAEACVSGTLLDYSLKYHACGVYMISATNRYRNVMKKLVKNTR